MAVARGARAELVAEVAVEQEGGKAVREGPVQGSEGVLAGRAGAAAGLLGDQPLEHAKGRGGLGVNIGVTFEVGEFGAEHETEVDGLIESESDVSATGALEPLGYIAGDRGGLLEAFGEEAEATGDESGDDGGLIREVVIRSLVADAGAAGDFAQRQAAEAGLGDQLLACVEYAGLQIR